MKGIYEKVARIIFKRGAFKFGAFKLKLHETQPDAPLSPFYINLRTSDNPKPGPLMPEDFDLIAQCIMEVLLGLDGFQAIAGIPRAGDPMADGIERIVPEPRGFRIVKLDKKEETDGSRCIIPLKGFEYREGEHIILLDDLVTKAGTKLEAIKAVEDSGGKVFGLVVLVDRQQGGKEAVEDNGYPVHVCFTIRELFDFYLADGLIDQTKYDECMAYLEAT